MLGRLRIVTRLIGCLTGTAALALIWFGALPFISGSPRRRRACRSWVFRSWARWCLCCLRVRLEVRGSAPQGPCFLVANHVSYLDILVLAACVEGVFVSMAEVVDWPFLGTMARSLGTVFIDREDKRALPEINREIEGWLDQGFTLILFPEGRTSIGKSVESFRPSLLEPAAQSSHPVACATLGYRTAAGDPPASQVIPWGTASFRTHIPRLLRLKHIEARVVFAAERIHDDDRKALARRLHAQVAREFEPLE